MGVTIYIDNIIIFAPDLETYKLRLLALFQACKTEGYKIKMSKSHHFITESFLLFGFQVDLINHTIKPETEKVDAIRNLPIPKTKKLLKSFIGSISYFNNLIPKLQIKLAPLHEAAKPTSGKFIWTSSCNSAFEFIKKRLSRFPLLYLLRPDKKIYFTTDGAMGQFIAYVLWQYDEEKMAFVPIKFNSHKLSKSELNLSQHEVEALALIFCLMKEESLLAFGNSIFYTDARSLTFISSFSNVTTKIGRWDILIKSYGITLSFLPNKDALIKITDLLTRNADIIRNHKHNKITKQAMDEFFMYDFAGLPEMSGNDFMELVTRLNKIYKNDPSQQRIALLREVFPAVPHQISIIGNFKLYCQPGQYCGQIGKIEIQSKNIQSVILNQVPSICQGKEVFDHISMEELIANYLPGASIATLIDLQNKDPWISKILSSLPTQTKDTKFFMNHNILMRKYEINNIQVNQIVLPSSLSEQLIKYFHTSSLTRHFGQ